MAYRSNSDWQGNFGQGATSTTEHNGGDGYAPFVLLIRPFNARLRGGLTFVAPSAASDECDDDWIGRYLVTKYSSASYSAVPSLAWRIDAHLSVAVAAYVTYSKFEHKAHVFNLEPGAADGTVELDADGVSVGWGVSMLWEQNADTRFGLRYQSELDPQINGSPKFEGLGPITEGILANIGALNAKVNIRSRSPQRILIGAHHVFDNGWQVSVDAVWNNFSRFVLSQFRFDGNTFLDDRGKYRDIYAVTAGVAAPVNGRLSVGFGAMYTTSGVDDDDRTMILRLDDAGGSALDASGACETSVESARR